MEQMPTPIAYPNNSPSPPNPQSSSSILLLTTTHRKRNIETGGVLDSSQNQTIDHHHHHQMSSHRQQHKQRQVTGEFNQDPPDQPQLASTTTAAACASNSHSTPTPPQAQTNDDFDADVRYRECLKNHAANTGGHVVDGCGEFMPSGSEGTAEALKCAACGCHRSFHRRETRGGVEESQQLLPSIYHNNNHNRIRPTTNHHIQVPPLASFQQYAHMNHYHQFSHHYSPTLASPTTGGPVMMAFGRAGRGPMESSTEDLSNMIQLNARGAQHEMTVPPSYSVSKKRFRTKFSKEQKDKMHEVAEQLGWKIQKQDDEQVQKLCNELGIKRQVFKVWMHNNKQAMKKKQQDE